MDQYRCPPEELPFELYRIQYPGSRTLRTDEGLVASDTTTSFGDSELERILFKRAMENHFTWGYRGRSPFISLFSDRDHAESWGCEEPWCGSSPHREEWSLYTIDTCLLGDIYVFKVSKLVDDLGVRIPERAKQHVGGSYICLHREPARAILEEKAASDVKYCESPSSVEAITNLLQFRNTGIATSAGSLLTSCP